MSFTFIADICIFQNVLIILYLQTILAQRKRKVRVYTLSIVYEQFNNPTPSFKEPNLVGIIEVKLYENSCSCKMSCIF